MDSKELLWIDEIDVLKQFLRTFRVKKFTV